MEEKGNTPEEEQSEFNKKLNKQIESYQEYIEWLTKTQKMLREVIIHYSIVVICGIGIWFVHNIPQMLIVISLQILAMYFGKKANKRYEEFKKTEPEEYNMWEE